MNKSRFVWLVALSVGMPGSVVQLEVDTESNIRCTTDADCPEAFSCTQQHCVSLAANQPPRVVVSAPNRSVDQVTIPITVSDFEGDPVSFTVRYSDGGGFVAATVDDLQVNGTPEGVSAELIWQAATDLGSASYVADLVVEVTPTGGQPALSVPFEFGNDAPTLTLSPITGNKSGDVGIAFTLMDASQDLASVSVEFATGPAGPWSAAAVSLGSTGPLSTSPAGIEHAVIWNSREVPNNDPTIDQGFGAGPTAAHPEVYLRLVPSDEVAGQAFTGSDAITGPFGVDNTINAPPSIELSTPSGTQSGVVSVSYVLSDAESDDSDLVVEFSDGSGFVPATAGPGGDGVTALASSPTGVAHIFAWDTVADRVALSATNAGVLLRIAGRGTAQGVFAESAPITVDNRTENTSPQLSVVSPSGVASGNGVGIPFVITDDEGDPCTVEVEYMDAQGAWQAATPDAGTPLSDLSSSPTGTLHTFVWQSLADAVAPSQASISMRARVEQTSPSRSSGDVAFTVVVDNGADLNTKPEVVFADAGPVAVREADYDLYVLVRDAEGDEVDFEELSYTVNGTAWLTATTDAGAQSYTTTPQGRVYRIQWDAAADLAQAQALLGDTEIPMLSLRARVRDNYGAGATTVLNQDLAALESVPESPTPIDQSISTTTMAGLLATGGGEVHAVWSTPFGGAPYTLRYSVSVDAGSNWGADVAIATGVDGDDYAAIHVPGSAMLIAYGDDVSSNEQLRIRRSTNGGATWGIVNVSSGATETGQPNFFFESGTTVHLVWRDYDSVNSRVYHARSVNGGASWSTPVPVSGFEATDSAYPAVGVSGSTIVVTWRGASATLKTATSTNGGANWTGATTLSSAAAFSSGYSMVATPEGDLHLLAAQSGLRYQRRNADGSWEPAVTLDDEVTRPPLGVYDGAAQQLNIYYLYNDDGFIARRVSSADGGDTFGPNVNLAEGVWDQFAIDPDTGRVTLGTVAQFGLPARYPFAVPMPSLGLPRAYGTGLNVLPAIGHEGSAGVVTARGGSGMSFDRKQVPFESLGGFATGRTAPLQIMGRGGNVFSAYTLDIGTIAPNVLLHVAGSPDDGSTWHTTNTLTRGGSLAVDPQGNAHLVTIGSTIGTPATLSWRTSVDGGETWSDPEPLTTLGTSITYPSLVWSAGRLRLVYTDSAGGGVSVIRYTESTDGATWSAPVSISQNAARHATVPTIVAGAHSRLTVVWGESVTAAYQLRLNYSDDDGATWATARDAGLGPVCSSCIGVVSTTVDAAGDVVLGWVDAASGLLPITVLSRDQGTTWEDPIRHDAIGYPRMTSTVDGVYLTWGNNNSETVRLRAMRQHRVLHASPGSPLAIPDAAPEGVVSTLDVQSGSTMVDVGVWVDVNHDNAADLTITLTSPSGVDYVVVDRGASRVWDGPIIFTDGGIATVSALAPLEHTSVVGTWSLEVVDSSAGNTGVVRDWGLRFR